MEKVSWWRTSFGEDEILQIAKSISAEHISQGLVTAEFERLIGELLHVPYVVATTSGTMALLMALMAAGVGHGDEVIVPSRTWIATAHAPLLLGAKVILVDVMQDRPLMDVGQIEKKISGKTKAIIPVHLNGRAVDMDEVNRIAKAYDLIVIEDAAQAFCSRHGLLGRRSFAGCFSLSVAKLISTGQGGFIVTQDEETYKRLKLMRTHGVADLVNVSYTQMGFNFRFNDVLASIGIVQLGKLTARVKSLNDIYHKYEDVMHELPFIKFLPVDISAGEIPLYIEVLSPEREKLMRFFTAHDIQVRPFYPDLDTAEYLANDVELPNSRIFADQGIFLPCGPAQPLENVERVIDVLRLYGKQYHHS